MNPEGPHNPTRENDAIEARAAQWLVGRDAGLNVQQAAELARWRASDPRHERALRRAEAGHDLLARLSESPGAAHMASEVEALYAAHRARARRSIWKQAAVGLAAAAVIVLAMWLPGRESTDSVYTTTAEARKSVALPDGSTLALAESSEVRVRFQRQERRLDLWSGEVFFEVAEDKTRPFVVTAGSVTIEAVGTAFTVRRIDSAVDVIVTEGKVLVTRLAAASEHPDLATTLQLVAGEQARIATAVAGAAIADQPASGRDDAGSAVETSHMVFANTTLADAIEQFNRHNELQIEIRDSELRKKTLGGSFNADNAETFINLLVASGDIRVERLSDKHVVLHPAEFR
jgi:transmembrane sensor